MKIVITETVTIKTTRTLEIKEKSPAKPKQTPSQTQKTIINITQK